MTPCTTSRLFLRVCRGWSLPWNQADTSLSWRKAFTVRYRTTSMNPLPPSSMVLDYFTASRQPCPLGWSRRGPTVLRGVWRRRWSSWGGPGSLITRSWVVPPHRFTYLPENESLGSGPRVPCHFSCQHVFQVHVLLQFSVHWCSFCSWCYSCECEFYIFVCVVVALKRQQSKWSMICCPAHTCL